MKARGTLARNAVPTRPYAGDSDLPALVRLLVTCAADQHGEHYTLRYVRRSRRGDTMRPGWHAQLWQENLEASTEVDNREILGCALLGNTSLHFHVHPRARDGAVEAQMIGRLGATAGALARERGRPVTVATPCAENDRYRRGLLERWGFECADKHLLRMTRPLEGELPESEVPAGFALRRLTPGERCEDLASFADAFNAAMGGASSADTWRERLEESDGLPLLGVATEDGTYVAVSVCRVYREHNEAFGCREGWIEQMGTRPEWRRRGLGRAVLRASLLLLRQYGADTAVLETGSTNTRSQPLYLSEGFATELRINSYRKSVDGNASVAAGSA